MSDYLVVHLLVAPQTASCVKSFFAKIACEVPLVSVDGQMVLQGVFVFKPFLAQMALDWGFGRNLSLLILQMGIKIFIYGFVSF